MVIKVGDKWCKATTTWKFWWNFLAKSLIFSRYPSFSPFERPDAYKCYTFSESYGSRETREIKISTSKFDLEAQGILSPLWTQTGPWSDTASYHLQQSACNHHHYNIITWSPSWYDLHHMITVNLTKFDPYYPHVCQLQYNQQWPLSESSFCHFSFVSCTQVSWVNHIGCSDALTLIVDDVE